MYPTKIMLFTLVLIVISATNCHPYELDKKVKVQKFKNTSLLSDDKLTSMTINDNFNAVDNIYGDNIENENAKDSLSASQEPNQPYQKLSDFGTYNVIESDEEQPECILARSEFYLSWWVHENGSLRLPSIERLNTSGILDLALRFESESSIFSHIFNFTHEHPHEVIRFLTLASNKLSQIPASVLNLTSTSIQFLSLAGNNFHETFGQVNTTFHAFSSFPIMTNLLELDLRHCQITSLTYSYFDNLPKLDKLFLSHNNFIVITSEAFKSLNKLRHLDLSYNEIVGEMANRIDGLILENNLFSNLQHLMFLDLSHSELSRRSMRAFQSLGHELEQISLCYTNISFFERDMLSNTSLKVIDLSGNKELYENLRPHDFKSLENTLEIFVFRNASVKNAELIKPLKKLRMLDLRNNNVMNLTNDDFVALHDLEILDLASNSINDWHYRLFTKNEKLRILNLRTNNITIMRDGMLLDFYEIRFLAIGSNDFICACNLRDFIDRARRNALYQYCTTRSKRSIENIEYEDSLGFNNPDYLYDVFLREFHTIVSNYKESYLNMLAPATTTLSPQPLKHQRRMGIASFDENDCYNFDSDEATHMNFNFLLLDYNENDYKCVDENYEYYSRRRVHFNEIESCYNEARDSTEPYDGSSDDESNEETTYDNIDETPTTTTPKSTTLPSTDEDSNDNYQQRLFDDFQMFYLYILLIVPLSLMVGVWYWKRADIKYFFALFRNSLILSLDNDDKKTLMMTNRKKSTNSNVLDQYTYDVFVSYSDKDRSWVLDELIPNIEKRTQINICLHERDFQVGLSILENIIQCMDKSRCLLLVVSESFLKSNWCAFEMHLAQHRLIETRREQLILVLLQDIPRSRRSRTLQFLMRTKTYIMWPNNDDEDLRSNFWRRLKKAIILNNWEPEKKSVKPRHSIV